MTEKIRYKIAEAVDRNLKIVQSSFMRMYDKNAELEAENAHLQKRLEVLRVNRNDLFDNNVKLKAENDKLKEDIKKLTDELMMWKI